MSHWSAPQADADGDRAYFSPVLGGPLFRLFCRTHLSTDELLLLRRRIVVVAFVAWLPLLLLSVIEGRAVGAGVPVPFFYDFAVHIRFMVALPLLFVAEFVAHQRLRPVVKAFEARGLIPFDARECFDTALGSAFKARNSVVAELVIIALVYAVGVLVVLKHYVPIDGTTWFSELSPGGAELSMAGLWYGFVSLPIFQFLMLRWYYRVFIWARFMWQVSRLPLRLVPTHPDRAGGLGFLAHSISAFALLALAHSVVLAGQLLNRIVHRGASLPDFALEIGAMVVVLLLLALAPLAVFAGQLAQLRRTGLDEYGVLAQRLAGEFDTKWVRGGAPADEPLLGSPDISALADMGGSYEVIENMRSVPIAPEALIPLVVAILLPMLPLTLTMMPLDALVKALVGLMF
ncbi:hypothetical protein [Thauera sp. SWB20]|uniref:hypothetical protein n=1 Tax=Thauera sp. SWB20 TaxID=1572758 RepID=UPI0005AE0843|nr:hypothetical protein [Thauera sp. SWB20]KIN91118.1 putative membrane protein [Thauera sp. SWB20]